MTDNSGGLIRRRIESRPLGYYWFLTFDHAPELHTLAKECQAVIDPMFFAPTPSHGLHLTIDRIARPEMSTSDERSAIAKAAQRACRRLQPFRVWIRHATNIRGAIGFTIAPTTKVAELRDTLRGATTSVLPHASIKTDSSAPHVTIAYPIFEGLSGMAATAAASADHAINSIELEVTEAALVSLMLRKNAYTWEVTHRIELGNGH